MKAELELKLGNEFAFMQDVAVNVATVGTNFSVNCARKLPKSTIKKVWKSILKSLK